MVHPLVARVSKFDCVERLETMVYTQFPRFLDDVPVRIKPTEQSFSRQPRMFLVQNVVEISDGRGFLSLGLLVEGASY